MSSTVALYCDCIRTGYRLNFYSGAIVAQLISGKLSIYNNDQIWVLEVVTILWKV